jgi:hypothetical protein
MIVCAPSAGDIGDVDGSIEAITGPAPFPMQMTMAAAAPPTMGAHL